MAQPYVGEIRMFAGNFAPAGWMFCKGELIPISEYETLFNLIGTTYGGDGQSTFALPDLRGRVPIHMGTGSDGINYSLGEMGGVEQVTLTTSQMPGHFHPILGSFPVYGSNPGSTSDPRNAYPAMSPGNKLYSTALKGDTMAPPENPTFNTGSTDASQPHTNMQPYLCVNFIISMFGIYPNPT